MPDPYEAPGVTALGFEVSSSCPRPRATGVMFSIFGDPGGMKMAHMTAVGDVDKTHRAEATDPQSTAQMNQKSPAQDLRSGTKSRNVMKNTGLEQRAAVGEEWPCCFALPPSAAAVRSCMWPRGHSGNYTRLSCHVESWRVLRCVVAILDEEKMAPPTTRL